MLTAAIHGFETRFYPKTPVNSNVQDRVSHLPIQTDTIHFGKRLSLDLSPEPQLDLHTKENPFDATIISVETLKPENDDTPPEKADVVKVVLDVAGSNFATANGTRARIVPGHHLLILPNIPKHLQYLEAFRKLPYDEAEGLKLPDESHRQYLLEHRYSIADVEEGKNGVKVTLVIKRVEYLDENGKTRKGLVSNQLAGLKPGNKITIFGPNTNRFLMPPNRDTNMLLFSTGIAAMGPLMDFFQTRFEDQHGQIGETRLYSGYRKREDEICHEKYSNYAADSANRFSYTTAFSRDPENPQRLNELIRKDAEKILDLLDKDNTYVYFCGVYGVEVTVISTLLQIALERGRSIDEMLDRIQEMKKSGHWRVEGSRQPFRYN